MDWRSVDERLIKRGMILLELGFINDYDGELKRRIRVGSSSLDSYVKLIGVVGLSSMGSLKASRSPYIG